MNLTKNFYTLLKLSILAAYSGIRETASITVMDEVMDVFTDWDGSYIARPIRSSIIASVDIAPTCDCSNCPGSSISSGGGGWIPSGPLKNCKGNCGAAYQGDCLCTNEFHPTGCTLQNCTQEDSNLPASSFKCYCTPEFEPAGCVTHSNQFNPNCTSGTGYQSGCQCNETFHPNGCSISLCASNQYSGGGFVCVCGTICDKRLSGCVKEPK